MQVIQLILHHIIIKRTLPVCLVLFAATSASAQCKDSSTGIGTGIYCNVDLNPVCGCDGITYLNACNAIYYGGILNNNFTSGMCPGHDFVFYIYPNPVVTNLNLKLQIGEGVNEVSIMIVSRWGEIMHQSSVHRSTLIDGRLDNYYFDGVQNYAPGLYFFIVYSSRQLKVQKFVTGVL